MIGLLANHDRPEASILAREAGAYFARYGTESIMLNYEEATPAHIPDLILTFGGDGTLLAGARCAIRYGIPLMGINMGTVGFLTEAEPDHLTDALERIRREDFRTEERMLLNVSNIRTGNQYTALNDMVITRGGYARLIHVECTVNGEEFGVFTSDGMIAATPTGSTGYSLSAGGPIVDPGMRCIALTPVCAHSLQRCPCIVSPDADIRFRLLPERMQTAELQIDGIGRGTLNAGDEIRVTGSGKPILLLRLYPYHFYSLLHTKLREWGVRHG